MNSKDTKELNQLLKPIFDQFGVDAYICGHEHSLQYIKAPGKTHYFITGAGSETTPTIVYPETGKFAISENGFMDFSVQASTLTVQIVDYTGKILYTSEIKK